MMSELLDNFFKGTISSAVSKTLTAPIELWRIQRQNDFIPNSTIRDVIKFDIYGKVIMLILLKEHHNTP